MTIWVPRDTRNKSEGTYIASGHLGSVCPESSQGAWVAQTASGTVSGRLSVSGLSAPCNRPGNGPM